MKCPIPSEALHTYVTIWYNPREGLTTHLTGAALVETGRDEIWTISDRPEETGWVLVL
jgi:hypothetical protein